MELGAINMPDVLKELQKIGSWVKAHGGPDHAASVAA